MHLLSNFFIPTIRLFFAFSHRTKRNKAISFLHIMWKYNCIYKKNKLLESCQVYIDCTTTRTTNNFTMLKIKFLPTFFGFASIQPLMITFPFSCLFSIIELMLLVSDDDLKINLSFTEFKGGKGPNLLLKVPKRLILSIVKLLVVRVVVQSIYT